MHIHRLRGNAQNRNPRAHQQEKCCPMPPGRLAEPFYARPPACWGCIARPPAELHPPGPRPLPRNAKGRRAVLRTPKSSNVVAHGFKKADASAAVRACTTISVRWNFSAREPAASTAARAASLRSIASSTGPPGTGRNGPAFQSADDRQHRAWRHAAPVARR